MNTVDIALRGGGASSDAIVGDPPAGSVAFWATKRAFDVVGALLLTPILLIAAAVLLLANPLFNRGPLIFSQRRMGRHGRPFMAYKFRTMRPAGQAKRTVSEGVEIDRITPLGDPLRRLRIDELPQILNVLRGEMSLVGPRPDVYEHAEIFSERIPGYRARHAVRPGISGLAQVVQGYAEGVEMTARKTRYDLAYIRRAGWRLEAFVVARTVLVVLTGFGAR